MKSASDRSSGSPAITFFTESTHDSATFQGSNPLMGGGLDLRLLTEVVASR